MTVGERIRKARKSSGLTQIQLAAKLGISPVNISQLENDQREPKTETLQRIAEALNINFLYLLPSDVIDESLLTLIKASYTSDDAFYEAFFEDKASLLVLMEETDTQLAKAYLALNEKGQAVAVERVQELGKIAEYRATPPPPPPTEGDSGE